MTLKLWKLNERTGLWDYQRTVTSETSAEWLHIFKRGEPHATFVVSKNKPRQQRAASQGAREVRVSYTLGDQAIARGWYWESGRNIGGPFLTEAGARAAAAGHRR
jgi:hypothetical protein